MPYTKLKKNLKNTSATFCRKFRKWKSKCKKKYHNRNVYVMHFTVVRETYFV